MSRQADAPSLTAIESLEPRTLLSTGPVVWPSAPFHGHDYSGTIYVNQKGQATLSARSLASSSDFDGFAIFYDDPGTVTYHILGRSPVELAYYDGRGKPDQVSTPNILGGAPQITEPQPANKGTVYFGVRAPKASAATTYDLGVNGTPAGFIEPIKISHDNNAGADGSDISGVGDFDFYSFTTTRAGNWVVAVIPDRVSGNSSVLPLDATMNVFDSAGRPVGGTFTRPINSGAAGERESWTGRSLRSGSTYYVRVDGRGQSIGGYGVSVIQLDPPTVSIIATDAKALERPLDSATFAVTRSGDSDTDSPLKVFYSISGTATPAIDYRRLTGAITIAAGSLSASILLKPISDNILEPDETVILTLRPNRGYKVGQSKANATIADQGNAS